MFAKIVRYFKNKARAERRGEIIAGLLCKNVVLETERLILVPWTVDMAHDMLKIAKNPSVEHAGWRRCFTVKQAEQRIIQFLKGRGQRIEWAIADKSGAPVIGSAGVCLVKLKGYDVSMSVGYVIADAFWDNGFCTEAVRRIMEYVFSELQIDALCVRHYVYNTRSARVAKKCGFVHYGTFPLDKPNAPKSEVCYKITRANYLKQSAN